MINTQPKDRRALLACAMGKIPADLCITNVQLANVLTGEIYPCDVYVLDGYVVHVETVDFGKNIDAKEIVDGEGQYIVPGLIDAHIHIESSMLTPRNFTVGVLPHGTTTIITDPHELANVYGEEAVHYMHESSEDLPMRQLINIPSCVPAAPGLENAGAEFFAEEINRLAKLERVIGLAEIMEVLGVVNGEDRMMSIIQAARDNGLYLQGHVPYTVGRMLSAYTIGGGHTCHESRSPREFTEKLRNGMCVDSRESSIALNVAASVEGIKGMKFLDTYCACTDDREADDILNRGHMNVVIDKMCACGLEPIMALKAATINNARAARLENLGAIAPGYIADMILTKELYPFVATKVFYQGKVVAENGKLTVAIEEKNYEIETRNSVNLPAYDVDTFKFKAPIENGKIKANVMTYADHVLSATECVTEELDVTNGYLDISSDEQLKFVVCINRYGLGTIGYGLVRNFGSTHGAWASTISHDSHNLIVVFDKAEEAKIVVDELVRCGGGMAIAFDGKLQDTLELRLGGLMSTKSIEEVAVECQRTKGVIEKLGLTDMHNPLLRIVTLALPVVPKIKMSDLGMVDTINRVIVPLYAD